MRYYLNFLTLVFFFLIQCSTAQKKIYPEDIKTGAQRTDLYFQLIENKNIGIVANHTSMVNDIHLVDFLLKNKFSVTKVFSPEHGFRGDAGAGEKVNNQTDETTGLPVISLYGSHRKPETEDLAGIDIMIFDIQDVGVRAYTYISTMTYVMEACADKNIPVIILDRPNPNGHYVDGPVLNQNYRSFVGLHEIPLVHGMTIGEYAQMINSEGWLNSQNNCDLTVIPIEGYNHNKLYQLPVKPSPNLPTMNAIYLYPSLVLFEGTIMSVGRGTRYPFEVVGHPDYMIGSFAFKPESGPGAKNPKYEGIVCTGMGLIHYSDNKVSDELNIGFLLDFYNYFKSIYEYSEEYCEFFNPFFDKLAGSEQLQDQIISGMSEKEIRNSWQPGLQHFKEIRKKYLLYPDFN